MIHRHSGELHLRQVMVLLRRRRGVIATAVLMGLGFIGLISVLLQPRYTAKAQLIYEAYMEDGVEIVDEAAVETLVEMLVSPGHLQRLASALAHDAETAPERPAAPDPDVDVSIVGRITTLLTPAPPDAAHVPDFKTLQKDLMAYKERRSRLIAVTFNSPDPELAARVANLAIDLYMEAEAARQREGRNNALERVAERLDGARVSLEEAGEAVRSHRIAHGMTGSGHATALDEQIAELLWQKSLAKWDLSSQQEVLGGVPNERMRGAEGAENAGTVASGARDGAEGVLVSVARSNDTLADLTPCPTGFCEPETSTSTTSSKLLLGPEPAEARLQDIDRRLAGLRVASATIGRNDARLGELQREVDAAGQVYQKLLVRQADLLAEDAIRVPVRIVSIATVPEEPSSPNPALFVLPTLVATALAGGLLGILLERLDQRLRSQRDIEDALGIPCLGLIPKEAKAARPARLASVLRGSPFQPFTEAIRSMVAAVLQRDLRAAPIRTLLVTSSIRKEGKTTLALATAIYAAQLDRKVLLVDLDFRNSCLKSSLAEHIEHSGIELGQDSGLNLEVLTATDLGIDYVPNPGSKIDPISLLSNAEFERILTELRDIYDFIVVDSAPLSEAAESRMLARMVDMVVLAVKWGMTTAPVGRMALQQVRVLNDGKSVRLAAVVTQAKMRAHIRRRYDDPEPVLRYPQQA